MNIPICNETGTQQNPEIISDGADGAIITWEDYRDLDFLVDFLPLPPGKHADCYFDLLSAF